MITFNTGRWYGPGGQIISAIQQGDDVVFYDHTRHIEGVISHGVRSPYSVQNNYDKGFYEMPGPEHKSSLDLLKAVDIKPYWREQS